MSRSMRTHLHTNIHTREKTGFRQSGGSFDTDRCRDLCARIYTHKHTHVKKQVLDKVVDQLIQIDVEIVMMEEPADEGEGGMFDMELESEKGTARRENEERAEKLDAMMMITFEFLKGVCVCMYEREKERE
jgi:hypothetical protein